MNANFFLKTGGHFVISIKVSSIPKHSFMLTLNVHSQTKSLVNMFVCLSLSLQANCIDSTVPAEAVFQSEVKKLQQEQFKPAEQVTLEPFERDHACVVGTYRAPKKAKAATAA